MTRWIFWQNKAIEVKKQAPGLLLKTAEKKPALFFLDYRCFAQVGCPLGGKSLQVSQTFEKVCTQRRYDVARGAMRHQACSAQLLDTGVQCVGRDGTDTVLQNAEGLRVTVF